MAVRGKNSNSPRERRASEWCVGSHTDRTTSPPIDPLIYITSTRYPVAPSALKRIETFSQAAGDASISVRGQEGNADRFAVFIERRECVGNT